MLTLTVAPPPQAHARTIAILVSEKAELEQLLSGLRASLASKEAERSDAAAQLETLRTRLNSTSRDKHLLTEQSVRREKVRL